MLGFRRDEVKPGWRTRPRLLSFSLLGSCLLSHLPSTATERPRRRLSAGLQRLIQHPTSAVVAVLTLIAAAPTLATADDILIAAVGSRATPLNPNGAEVVRGVQDAIANLKASPSPLASQIRLAAYEDDCTARGGEAIAGKIAARGAALVVGHPCSAAAIAAAAVYARRGILFISPGARAPRFTEPRAGSTIFRLAGRDDRFGIETANLIQQRFHGQRVAIAHDKSSQSRTLADAVERSLTASGTKAAFREAYINGEKEYNALIARLSQQEPRALVIPAQPIEASIIFNGLIDKGSDATLISSDILAVPEIEVLAGRAPGRIITLLRDAQPASEAIALRSRAAIEAWAAALQRSASQDARTIGRALETEAADTAIGPLRFDTKGDAMMPSYVPHSWRDGGWQPLAPGP